MNKNRLVTLNLFIAFLLIFIVSIPPTKAESLAQGVISIVFDDNYDNQYDFAWASMQARGIRGTFYVRTETMETYGYLTYNELGILEDAGNEIASHSVTHRSFTTLSNNEIIAECENSKNILESYGLSISNFAYPNGLTTGTIDSIVDNYYASGRTAYNPPYLITDPSENFRIPGFSSEDEQNELESLLNIVDQTYSSNTWGIILFHNIIPNAYSNPYTTSLADFETFLDYVISKGLEILTVDQTINLNSKLTMTTNYGTVIPQSGLYIPGTIVTIEAFAPVAGVGERYVWEGWSGSGSGSYTGMNNPAFVTLSGPISQSGGWRHEYLLTVSSEYGEVSPSGENWYEAGSEVVFEAFAPVAGVGERYVWEGWSGSLNITSMSSNLIMRNEPLSLHASWQKQYLFLFNQQGLPSDFDLFLIINAENQKTPYSVWIDEGNFIEFNYPQVIPDGFITQYVLTMSSNNSIIKSDFPTTIIANYNLQYDTNLFLMITIIVIVIGLILAIIFMKKKNLI